MIFIGLAFLMIYYVAKRGIDYFLLAAGMCVIYFYPILFLDRIVFVAVGIHSVDVDPGARLSLVLGIVYLLSVGYCSKKIPATLSAPVELKTDFVLKKQGSFVAVVMLALMVMLVVQNGLGLGGRDKSEVMESLGYIYKVYMLLTAILISLTFVLKDRRLLFVSVAAVVLDLLFGFRGGLATFIAAYFLTRTNVRGIRTVVYLLLGIFAALLMVIAKETAYFSKDMVEVAIGFSQSLDSGGVDFLSMANAESATISAVYNEIVKNNFSVPLVYLFDGLIAFLPFTNLLGYEAVGFDTYFKGVLFGAEGASFASGMLGVGYGLGGYFGVALCFASIAGLGTIFNRSMAKAGLLVRALIVAIAAVLLTSFYRSDFIYLAGLVRSLIVIVVLLALYGLMLRILADKSSASAQDVVDP